MCDVVGDMEVDPRDQRIAELEAEILLLKKRLAEALARIEEIEKAAHRQAGPFRREEKKKVPPQDQKKPGRKPGHEGFFRQAPEVIDREIDVPLDSATVSVAGTRPKTAKQHGKC